jgi:transposase
MQKFDEQFKMMVIRRIKESGKSPVVVARELHLSSSTLYSWMSKIAKNKGENSWGKDHILNTNLEICKIRKENLDLKKENVILKKAAIYFAKNQK